MIFDRFYLLIQKMNDAKEILNSFQGGSLILPTGNHAIEIGTRDVPVDVWFSIKDSGFMPVCNGDVDKLGFTISDKGFILYADVVSSTIQIEWVAIFPVGVTPDSK